MILPANDADLDLRGDLLNNDIGSSQFMTYHTPNSGTDQVRTGYCVSTDETPCITSSTAYIAARSKHPGGVTSVFGDGSVHFMSDNVALDTWRAVSSMAGRRNHVGRRFLTY